MRIGFLQAIIPHVKRELEYPPLGLGYLSAYLKKYTEFHDIVFATTVEELANLRPNLVGISAVTQNYEVAIDQARQLRELCQAPVVIGGPHITGAPDSLDPAFDVGVVGEGEETFRELVEAFASGCWNPAAWSDIDGICYRTDVGQLLYTRPRVPLAPLDKIPPPDRDLIGAWWNNPALQAVSMLTSRGCPYTCVFCSSKRHFAGSPRYHSPEYIVAELHQIVARWHPTAITFWDDLFIAQGKRLSQLADLIVSQGLDEQLEFYCSVRANLITAQRLRDMLRMNIRGANFGAESASARVLKYLKGTEVNPSHNQAALEMMASTGLKPACSFVVGAPLETAQDLQLTLDFARRNRHLLTAAEFWPLVPFPGTPLWQTLIESGKIPTPVRNWSRFSLNVRGNGSTFWDSYLYLNENMSLQEFKMYFYQLQEESLLLEIRSQEQFARAEIQRYQQKNGELQEELRRAKLAMAV